MAAQRRRGQEETYHGENLLVRYSEARFVQGEIHRARDVDEGKGNVSLGKFLDRPTKERSLTKDHQAFIEVLVSFKSQ